MQLWYLLCMITDVLNNIFVNDVYSNCLSFHVIHTCMLISVGSQAEEVLHTFYVDKIPEYNFKGNCAILFL